MRFGVQRYAEARFGEHGEVVGAVANANRVGEVEVEFFGEAAEAVEFACWPRMAG